MTRAAAPMTRAAAPMTRPVGPVVRGGFALDQGGRRSGVYPFDAASETSMPVPADDPDPLDPFGVLPAMDAWCCLLKAARELGDADEEMRETMLEAGAGGSLSAARIQGIEALMRSLHLDPDAVRRRDPATMRDLEAACSACAERRRCEDAIRAGTAAATYPAFCPNAARIDRLRGA
jgi:DNA-binding protein YbaB